VSGRRGGRRGDADGECADEFDPYVSAADRRDATQACIDARRAAVPRAPRSTLVGAKVRG